MLRCNTNPNMTEGNDICGGGDVIFNTSHQNYIYSLSVQHQWLCSSVSKPFLLQDILVHLSLSRKSAVHGWSQRRTWAPSSTLSPSGSWWTSGAGNRSSTSPTSHFFSAGWLHILSLWSPSTLTLRLVSFHVTDHYWAFLILTALGTSFFPVGVRAGWPDDDDGWLVVIPQVHHHSRALWWQGPKIRIHIRLGLVSSQLEKGS